MRRSNYLVLAAIAGLVLVLRLSGTFRKPFIAPTPENRTSAANARLSWNSTFGKDTRYIIQLSGTPDFPVVLRSTITTQQSYTWGDLSPNTKYFSRVSTSSMGPFTDLGAMVTPIEAPAEVVFDEISETAITAAAYAPTPAFSRLEQGQSGINIALDGVYQGWTSGNKWSTRASMQVSRFMPAAVSENGRIFAIGGYGGRTGIQASVEMYEPEIDKWSAAAPMSIGRNYLAAAAGSGRIYAIGGFSGSDPVANNETYSSKDGRWIARRPMHTARTSFGLAFTNGKLYAIGGQDSGPDGREFATGEEYDPGSDTWKSIPTLMTSRAGLAVVAVGGNIYALGGGVIRGAGTVRPFNDNSRLDPVHLTWEQLAPMPTARLGLAAAVVGRKIYVIGGNDGNAAIGTTEEYDPAVNRWVGRPDMPTAREQMAAASAGGKIFVVGGGDGTTWSTLVEGYDPGVSKRFSGLTPNSHHTFKAKARNMAGAESGETATTAVFTMAASPGSLKDSFTDVSSAAFSVHWSSGNPRTGYNPNGTAYIAQLSRTTDFKSIFAARKTQELSATFDGLTPGSRYFARIIAFNGNDRATEPSNLGSVKTETQSVRAKLIADLKSESDVTRIRATTELGMVNWSKSDVVVALIGALGDKNWNVRFNAAFSLSRQKPAATAALPALKVAMRDSDERVRANARLFFKEIGDWESPHVRTGIALESLDGGRAGPPRTPATLLALKLKEQSAKGHLGSLRSALDLYLSDHQGAYPPSLDKLIPTYIQAFPVLEIADHSASKTVETPDMADIGADGPLRDTGHWLYVHYSSSPLTGGIYIDCGHGDSSAYRWIDF